LAAEASALPAGAVASRRGDAAMFRAVVIAALAVAVMTPVGLIIYQSFLDGPFFDEAAKPSLWAFAYVLTDSDFWKALVRPTQSFRRMHHRVGRRRTQPRGRRRVTFLVDHVCSLGDRPHASPCRSSQCPMAPVRSPHQRS